MNIAVLCNGAVLQPALEALYSQGLLAGVATPEATATGDPSLALEAAVRQGGVPFLRVNSGDLTGQLAPWLEEINADALCCMGFPRKLPAELLCLPRLGCFNFHGGHLPSYRGPDPVFWQIRNQERFGTITVHRMTLEIDAGAIAHAAQVPLGPADTYALHMQRLGAVLPRVMIEFVQQLSIHGADLPLQEQDAATARYLPRPADADRTIDWSCSVAEIDALVRACNPVYGGALTFLKGIPVRILEVAMAPPCTDNSQDAPGMIANAGAEEGIRIVCGSGESLWLKIVCAADGFFSGQRLAKIFGPRPGDRML